MSNGKFYQLPDSNEIVFIDTNAAEAKCCGKEMKELVPNSSGAAKEKHVPVVEIDENIVSVTVGEVIHPMEPEHFIQWIVIFTENGMQKKKLHPGDEPKAVFALAPGDKFIEAYEYCNLHGLWKTEQ